MHACLSAQSCLTLCNPMDRSPPGSSVHGIFQARIWYWVAISFSRGSSQPRDWTGISCVSCIGRQILYCWATWEAPLWYIPLLNILLWIILLSLSRPAPHHPPKYFQIVVSRSGPGRNQKKPGAAMLGLCGAVAQNPACMSHSVSANAPILWMKTLSMRRQGSASW